MRKNTGLASIIFLILSCNSADNKIPQIATDTCNCFTDIEKNISNETKVILANAAGSDDPRELQKEVAKLRKEDQDKVLSEMNFFNGIDDERSEVGQCIKNVRRKYGYDRTMNTKKFEEKIIRQLETQSGCHFTASIWKLSLKLSDKK